MKEYKEIIIATIFLYIVGCAMNASFNIAEWNDTIRYILGIFLLIGGGAVVVKNDK